MVMTARQYAEYLVGRMETTGRRIVVYVKNGVVASATEGASYFSRVESECDVVVGYYDADCLARHLTEDLKEFFQA